MLSIVPCDEYSLAVAICLFSFITFIKSSKFSFSSLSSYNMRNPNSFKYDLVEQNICPVLPANINCKSVYTASVIKDATVLTHINSYSFS